MGKTRKDNETARRKVASILNQTRTELSIVLNQLVEGEVRKFFRELYYPWEKELKTGARELLINDFRVPEEVCDADMTYGGDIFCDIGYVYLDTEDFLTCLERIGEESSLEESLKKHVSAQEFEKARDLVKKWQEMWYNAYSSGGRIACFENEARLVNPLLGILRGAVSNREFLRQREKTCCSMEKYLEENRGEDELTAYQKCCGLDNEHPENVRWAYKLFRKPLLGQQAL